VQLHFSNLAIEMHSNFRGKYYRLPHNIYLNANLPFDLMILKCTLVVLA